MINDRYVKKSPNISFFYSWSDVNIEGTWASSHQYLWQTLACLWSPLKSLQQKPRPFSSPGTNMLQYIILESSQATWNVESERFEGGEIGKGGLVGSNTILEARGGFSCISPWRDIRLLFFLLVDLAPLTHSFPCWVRVFVHSQHILAA